MLKISDYHQTVYTTPSKTHGERMREQEQGKGCEMLSSGCDIATAIIVSQELDCCISLGLSTVIMDLRQVGEGECCPSLLATAKIRGRGSHSLQACSLKSLAGSNR